MPVSRLISRAPAFKLFSELAAADIVFDFHMHTTWSDGTHSAAEMASRARELGITAIAITDHVNRGCPWYARFHRELTQLRESAGTTIYMGLEAKALDAGGTLDASPDLLEQADLVIGSVHRYPDGEGGLIPLADIPSLGAARAAELEFGLALGLVSNRQNGVHVLGHPFGVYSTRFPDVPMDRLRMLMQACRDHGVAFEISTRYCRDLAGLASLLAEVNPPVSIGSDAHSRDQVGREFGTLREVVSRCR